MFKIYSLILFLLAFTLLNSCGNSASQKAFQKIQEAQQLYNQGNTNESLSILDSVTTNCKDQIKATLAANKLKQQIYNELIFNEQKQLDSINHSLDSLARDFKTEKTAYDRYTQYIYKRQDPTKRWDKSYLQVHLNEKGELYLSSNYFGDKWLNHTAIRVYDGNLQAKTDKVPLDDVMNHHSDFMDTKWEKVTYREGKDNGVIQFIANHADKNLKAVFLGKRYYYIILESYDKKAFKEAYELSGLLKKQIQLKDSLKTLQAFVH